MHPNNILKWCSTFMLVCGVHPAKKGGLLQDILFISAFSSSFFIIYLGILLTRSEGASLNIIGDAVESILLTCHGAIKLIGMYTQRNRLNRLFQEFERFVKIEDVHCEKVKLSCLQTMKILKTLVMLFLSTAFASLLAFTSKPIFFSSPVYMTHIPESVPNNTFMAFQEYTYVTLYLSVLCFDVIYTTMVLSAAAQFKILNWKLEGIFSNDDKVNRKQIKEWVDYHNFLLSFIETFNRAFSTTLLCYFGNVIVAMCVEMFITSIQKFSGNTIKYVAYMSSVFIEFIMLYCIPGQILTNEADKTKRVIWTTNWYDYPTRTTASAMRMIQVTSQKDVYISAGIVNATLSTCLQTLKTISSYYMFLRTMNAKNGPEVDPTKSAL